jgi:glutathionyl-hydroquinone reductase
MGLLINGRWSDEWYDTKSTDGKFERELSSIRHCITKDGVNDLNNTTGFKAESDRYHLYVSLACPWAHRALIFRKLKNLEKHISVSIVSPNMLKKGWTFCKEEGGTGDTINHFNFLHEIYTKSDSNYTGRVTVPILWDKKTKSIVNNESSEIIRILNSSFNHICNNEDDYYPVELQSEIDNINEFIYTKINNGVYLCGFSTSQEAYECAYENLFFALDHVENILGKNRYLIGSRITEADWRLFTTLIRFDVVYYGHFKCNKRSVESYPNISEYVRELYQWSGVKETVDFKHIKHHYYYSHTMINPTQIVPLGPEIDFLRKHRRAISKLFIVR